ncbi:MAG: Sua5/YciO/YrdC/YwlC family protein [Candidatus Delongbacteria bacterium]|nr:Sua5/YciO/YrdC/YwlC family protein [Candidatus Delongbacteria bacterium]MBN2836982.1 Sua5/YciO/YrdC/YwlC family protein [Candidatus Delongbacteria bacterium]
MILEDQTKLLEHLKSGDIAIIPTDTIYGFSCIIDSTEGENKIRTLKNRDNKPFIIIDSVSSRIYSYFDRTIHSFIDKMMIRVWPDEVTLLAKSSDLIKRRTGLDKIAVRFTSNELIKFLTENLNSGLFSTSVNITGEKELIDPFDIINFWNDKVPVIFLILNYGTSSSAIIEFENNEMRILRSGSECAMKKVELLNAR